MEPILGKQLVDEIKEKLESKTLTKEDIENPNISGLYNVGTGKPRSFIDLTDAVFRNFNQPKRITFIDTPKKIRAQYQYFTKAEISKLRQVGYKNKFYSLEDGINEYINKLLKC